ncbi:MAG TPA: hypothetical protein VJU82_14560 [Acidobacteriaceae bacterium]|nr:hypothetical protein [Acidobacteriaceae bacterium]
MLLSLTRKFLFIANLKTASTSIERVLGPHSEIRLNQSRFGKHMSFSEFAERFKWILNTVNINELFIFGVMRDPADYVLSLYNSHRVEQFRNSPKLYTGNMDFTQFIAEWVPKNHDQLRPQYSRFTSAEGRLVTNLLVSFDKLAAGMEMVAEQLQMKDLLNLPKSNPSPPGITLEDLTPEQQKWIDTRFEKDREFMAKYCDRLLV